MDLDDEILDDFKKEPDQPEDELHMGLRVLSFCIPIAGAIIYFTTDSQLENKKQQACTAALLGIGLNIFLKILGTVVGG